MIENEISPAIRIVAEGHLDLRRKLDEALVVEAEKELLQVRVGRLESDVREIKSKLGHSA